MNNINNADARSRRLTINLSFIDGILLILFFTISGGPIATSYAIKLGADQSTIGVLLSMPLITQGFSIFAPWLAGLFGKRKGLAVATAIIGRLIWGLAIFAPFWFSSTPQVGWFVALIGLSNVFLAINTSLWFDLIGCVVPSKQCVSYFVSRNAVITLLGTALNIFVSRWLDLSGTSVGNLQLILTIGVILSLIGGFVLFFYYEPGGKVEKTTLIESVKEPIGNKNFIKILVFSFFAMFSIFMLAPTTQAYFLQELKLQLTQIAGWMSITALVGFFFARLWGKTLDKSGAKPMLYISIPILAILLPIFYLTATSKGIWMIFAGAPIESLILGIVSPAILGLVFRGSSIKNRSPYIAIYLLVTGIASSLGAMSFGPLYNFLEQFKFIFLGIDFNGYRWMFALSGLIKFISLGLLKFIDEPPNSFGLEPLTTRQTVFLLARESVDTFKQNVWSVKQTVKYILASVFKRRKSDLNE